VAAEGPGVSRSKLLFELEVERFVWVASVVTVMGIDLRSVHHGWHEPLAGSQKDTQCPYMQWTHTNEHSRLMVFSHEVIPHSECMIVFAAFVF
jgi:hypothetical protein